MSLSGGGGGGGKRQSNDGFSSTSVSLYQRLDHCYKPNHEENANRSVRHTLTLSEASFPSLQSYLVNNHINQAVWHTYLSNIQ